MENILTDQIIIAAIFGILGAVVGIVVWSLVQFYFRKRRARQIKPLEGEWISLYHDLETTKDWVNEKVTISIKGDEIILNNYSNTFLKSYEAKLKVYEKIYLTGTWSVKSTAEFGIVNLVVDRGFSFMYGFWSQVHNSGANYYGGWIIAKGEVDVPKAKDRLNETLKILMQKNFK